MIDRIAYLVLIVACGLAAAGCRSVENYTDPNEPLFEGAFAEESPAYSGDLLAATWNLHFAEEIETAIEDLGQVEELAESDFLLLQEMDEIGVEEIARELGYNYVYYPASVHNHHDKNFGNAILSKWPLSNPEKLILPHKNPRNGQIRIASKATADVNGWPVHIYSVHTETNWLGLEDRREQIDAILEDLPEGDAIVIVGGDFNTLTPGGVESLVEQFEEAGLEKGGAEAGPTVGVGRVGFTLDHIFTRGLEESEAGTWPESSASDHNPLWVKYWLGQP